MSPSGVMSVSLRLLGNVYGEELVVLIMASIVAFVTLATPVGFLLVAPPCLVVLLLALGRRWGESLLWALGATLVVHLVFYKMLRVPLPWGLLPPLY